MRRISFGFLILVVLPLVLLFALQLKLDGSEGKKVLIKRPEPPADVNTVGAGEWQAKRERFIEQKGWRERIHTQFPVLREPVSSDNPNALNIELVPSYTYWQNGLGDVHMTALCHNAGSSYAALVEAEVTFYDDNQDYLGTVTGYVYGGTRNVQCGTDGYSTNELAPDEYGFFWVWPEISYADAGYYSVSFSAVNSTSWPYANALLDFEDGVYQRNYQGYLNVFGDIKNSSSNYVTYFSRVAFAIFNNNNTKVIDVDLDFVDGSTYGESESAIYPGTSEPFDTFLVFAAYNQSSSGSYLAAFEWFEDYYNTQQEKDPPFGSFDTPANGSTLTGSAAFTGWALDDSGIESVKIYRGSGSNMIYIGDAMLVEGARPDLAEAYPQYPGNTKAGWGYMMLTNFLPNNGNGTFKVHAVATDINGKSTTLGTKTIYCKNSNAVNPFGAIDTPAQGGTASGSSYVNWGWVLTPQPKTIPADGSTIDVYVDGVYLGHPEYNIYREDIASLFSSYNNSSGAIGYFTLDTTDFSNGVHIIYWIAEDNYGAADGIGSRYFTINNNSSSNGLNVQRAKPGIKVKNLVHLQGIPSNAEAPVTVKRGFGKNTEPRVIPMEAMGSTAISIEECERLEVTLRGPVTAPGRVYAGFLVNGNRLHPLPIGSTLDAEKGIFYWHPGPGFLGRYKLSFVEKRPDGEMSRRDIAVDIHPRRYDGTK